MAVVGDKHLSSAGGTWATFDSTDIAQVQEWVADALRSEDAVFMPNSVNDTFRLDVPMGRQVGTRASETGIRIIVTFDGRVINAFPDKPGAST